MLKRNYCEEHLWRVYAKGTAVRPRPKKERKIENMKAIVGELQEIYDEMVSLGEIEA